MITMLATLCHMATISPGMPAIEFCQEVIIDRSVDEATKENLIACYIAAQPMIAQRIVPGYTLHSIRCAGAVTTVTPDHQLPGETSRGMSQVRIARRAGA